MSHDGKRQADHAISLARATSRLIALKSSTISMCRYCLNGAFGLQITRTKECTVCSKAAFVDQFPKSPHAGSEKHGRDVCFSCWEQHIRSEVDSKEWNEVSCAPCDHILGEGDIKNLDLNFTSRLYLQ